MSYTVKFYKGDYFQRQQAANADRAVAYVEHHFNSSASPSAGYAVVVVGSNASSTSRNWGRWYAKAVAEQFGTQVGGDGGILVGGWEGRGDGNVKHTKMPAVLLEPLFASNPQQADAIRSEAGQAALARILVESVRRFFPDGRLVAFSVGHKYKTSSPNDRGAALAGGGTEADHAELVLQKTAQLLAAEPAVPTQRMLRVMRGETLLFETPVDEDATLSWSSERNLLFIADSGDTPAPPAAPRALPAAGKAAAPKAPAVKTAARGRRR
ncbi:MAG: N-acetylmuramoyl-L-alanine amidase [Proteobacteria bacterium]|nr:N-acetylmuramoyl-L-alanine amidase [Pseudomonadota bacterium]